MCAPSVWRAFWLQEAATGRGSDYARAKAPRRAKVLKDGRRQTTGGSENAPATGAAITQTTKKGRSREAVQLSEAAGVHVRVLGRGRSAVSLAV